MCSEKSSHDSQASALAFVDALSILQELELKQVTFELTAEKRGSMKGRRKRVVLREKLLLKLKMGLKPRKKPGGAKNRIGKGAL